MTPELQDALASLNSHGYNATDPHPILDSRDRLAAIAHAASDAGLSADNMRPAVRASMDNRTDTQGESRPFPESRRLEVLLRIEAMMDFIAWQKAGH